MDRATAMYLQNLAFLQDVAPAATEEAASGVNYRTVGLAVFIIVFLAFIFFLVRNIFLAKPEVGAEIELAANRKEYYGDEDLEGKRLDRSLGFALVSLCFIALAGSFYYIAEPGRQDGAVAARDTAFILRGEENYGEKGCVGCHLAEGKGGDAPYVLQDADGQFIANATWKAPALDTVLLRYSEDEVRHILDYGRSGSPMAAWGTPGGGPLTKQSVANIIMYLETLQVQSLDKADIAAAGDENPENEAGSLEDQESVEADALAEERIAEIRAEVDRSVADGEFSSVGEAVFNLGLYSGYGGGALSCGRCHTAGWSLGATVSPNILAEGVAGCGGGVSGIGFNLCGDSLKGRFPDDTWKRADGSWMPSAGLTDAQGIEVTAEDGSSLTLNQYIEAADGSKVYLDDKRKPVTDEGDPYFILTAPLKQFSAGDLAEETESEDDEPLEGVESESDSAEESVGEETAEDSAISDTEAEQPVVETDTGFGQPGDLLRCDYISKLYTPEGAATYAVDPDAAYGLDDQGEKVAPEALEPADVPGTAYVLASGKVVSECELVEMPERTSQAQYDFIYTGGEKGKPYGAGGQSSEGMMPGFGKILPPDYIQEVVDYERGLK